MTQHRSEEHTTLNKIPEWIASIYVNEIIKLIVRTKPKWEGARAQCDVFAMGKLFENVDRIELEWIITQTSNIDYIIVNIESVKDQIKQQ